MSTRYKDAPYTVGCMLCSSPFKHPTVEHMCKLLKREVHHLWNEVWQVHITRLNTKVIVQFFLDNCMQRNKKTMPLPCIKLCGLLQANLNKNISVV